ncbi:MAG: LCP family protein [Candidatus Saccharimonadales bacterium]
MKDNKSNVEGFILRRPGDKLGDLHFRTDSNTRESLNKPISAGVSDSKRTIGGEQPSRAVGRAEIDESLSQIDEQPAKANKKLTRKQRKLLRKMSKKQQTKKRKIAKWLSIVFVVILLFIGGYIAYRLISAGGNIFQGNILNIFQNKPLKQDENGRSNFLILGTSEDDPGHGGGDLTDSILVVSLDQNKKNIYIFNVPRDLYVEYGEACLAGYSGKINAYFSCSDSGTTAKAEQNRLKKTQKFIGDIFGLDIQYGVHVNHTVIKEVVDAIGGIDVDIQGSNGDPGILDRNFDWRCNYTCYLVKYDNGVHHLDGEHALYLAQARGDIAPTYGLGNSNFDREKNQQKILVAVKDKATSTGTLTNLSAVSKLIDALGNNLRSNISTDEIRTIMNVLNDTDQKNIHTISLVTEGESVVKTGVYGGASVVMPAAGIYNYQAIQTYIKKKISSDEAILEAAPIAVLNGSGQAGVAQSEADRLSKLGLTISFIGNVPEGDYSGITIYQVGSGYTATVSKLQSLYNISISKETPPVNLASDIKFIIIIGSNY